MSFWLQSVDVKHSQKASSMSLVNQHGMLATLYGRYVFHAVFQSSVSQTATFVHFSIGMIREVKESCVSGFLTCVQLNPSLIRAPSVLQHKDKSSATVKLTVIKYAMWLTPFIETIDKVKLSCTVKHGAPSLFRCSWTGGVATTKRHTTSKDEENICSRNFET